ncbi:DNA-3-methyladenine glycosylase family protein [Paenibacillus senegalensis]|uniref:DNA-3-methyladenine glycosylase family protein n=1 Tax=Paenibacillus senegalensis TaxID=1465766 RepID=UPI0002897356|nr:DNA-3-methyladenine glycosylase [Paenibacillus senegalensis]
MSIEKTRFFTYGTLEMDYLKEADPDLGQVIERLGKIEREVMPDLFTALIHAIVGQLVSAKAVVTIWTRMQERLGAITPDNLAKCDAEDIQRCGMTMKKALCIRSIARLVAEKEFDLEELKELPDDEVIQQLSTLNGIGKWTAEMLLLHSMERPDVVSWGDIAIRRGMMRLYNLTSLTKAEFDKYRSRYSPYGSVASIYLWALSHND